MKREQRLAELNGESARLANSFQEQMMDTCPVCKTAFNDFDGCNSLTCGTCNAKFCSLCLKQGECPMHGHSYGYPAYKTARAERVDTKFVAFIALHFKGKTNSPLFRLFSAHLTTIGVRPSSMPVLDLPGGFVAPAEDTARCFIANSLVQVRDRIEDERRSMVERGTVCANYALPPGYHISLEKSTRPNEFTGTYSYFVNIFYKYTQMKLEDLPNEEETMNIRWVSALCLTRHKLLLMSGLFSLLIHILFFDSIGLSTLQPLWTTKGNCTKPPGLLMVDARSRERLMVCL